MGRDGSGRTYHRQGSKGEIEGYSLLSPSPRPSSQLQNLFYDIFINYYKNVIELFRAQKKEITARSDNAMPRSEPIIQALGRTLYPCIRLGLYQSLCRPSLIDWRPGLTGGRTPLRSLRYWSWKFDRGSLFAKDTISRLTCHQLLFRWLLQS